MDLTAEVDGKPAVSALGDFIVQRMEALDIGVREVARRSGGLVSPAQVSYLTSRGRSQRISDDVLKGLCRALRVKQADILDRLELDQGVPYAPPAEAAFLSAEQRKVVDAVIRQLAAKHLDN